MQSKLVLLTTAVVAVSAQHPMAFPKMRRALEGRDDDLNIGDIPATCTDAILELATGIPTPPPALVTAAIDLDTSDPCAVSVPPSLSKDISAYASSVVSWYSAHEDDVSSAMKACPILTEYVGQVPECANQFITGTATTEGSESTKDSSATKTASSSDNDSTTATETSASSTETSSDDDNAETSSSSEDSTAATSASASASSDATGTDSTDAAATSTDAPSAGAKQIGSVVFALAAAGLAAFL